MTHLLSWFLAMTATSSIAALLGLVVAARYGIASPQYALTMLLSVAMGAIATLATL